MKPVKTLFRAAHGSHLYGTSTPASDHDFKGVHLPSGEGIIMGRVESVICSAVVAKEGTKNTADAIDDDSYSLQKFFDMLMKGDTVATEILFAPTSSATIQDPLWGEVQAVGKLLLNRQCKGFVGYCVRQAAKYGIKGSRMNAVKALLDALEKWERSYGAQKKLGECYRALDRLVVDHEHMSFENIPHPDGKPCVHLVCCDRKMPETVFIGEAIKVWRKVWENYGERARAAASNEGIDWKAMSHAVRVAEQAIELLRTGNITFPRPNADVLLTIKLGECRYEDVSKLLELLVVRVQECSLTSKLPEQSDRQLADNLVRRLYLEQTR